MSNVLIQLSYPDDEQGLSDRSVITMELPLVVNACFGVWLSNFGECVRQIPKVGNLQSKTTCMLLIPLAQPVSKLRRFEPLNDVHSGMQGVGK